MFIIIVVFLAGLGLGYILRNIRKLNFFSGRISFLLVFLLLFSLGLSVGMNETIIGNLPLIGLKSLVITFFTVSGSIGFLVLYKKLKKK